METLQEVALYCNTPQLAVHFHSFPHQHCLQATVLCPMMDYVNVFQESVEE